MKKTSFAGLTILEPGEGLDTDNGAFISRDRAVMDRLLQLGAKTHRHSGHAGLANPAVAPSASIVASAGHIAPELTISIGYTLEDADAGETQLSPLATVSTGTAMSPPPAAPSGVIDYTGGSLLTDTYYYATTFIDADGGETPAGPAVEVVRAPGFASGQADLSNLTYGMTALGAVGWRLYRAIGGGSYELLATGGTSEDTFTDSGAVAVQCDTHPPTDSQNTTKRTNTLQVKLPGADANMASAAAINIYGTISGTFGQAALLGQYPLSSAGKTVTYTELEFNDAAPPDVNLSIGTAHQIDPDTELLDWHWKRPVSASASLGSGTLGDVKLVESNGGLYAVLAASAIGPADWVRIASAVASGGGGGGGGSPLTASAAGVAIANVTEIDFTASGGASLSLREVGPGRALVTIAAASAVASAASGLGGIERFWASAATASVASGASALLTFPASASVHLFRISTDKRARVRAYGSEAARLADLGRAIGTDPSGDHGVQLDYANTAHASGGTQRITPIVHGVNLKSPPEDYLYLTVDNFDATGPVTVAFLYAPIELDNLTTGGSSVASGGATTFAASATGGRLTGLTELDFLGASGAIANIASLGGGVARITITPAARIVRGKALADGTKDFGKGFSVSRVSTGVYVIKWDRPFVGFPLLSFTPVGEGEEVGHPQLGNNEQGECTVAFWKGGIKVDTAFQVTAISQDI